MGQSREKKQKLYDQLVYAGPLGVRGGGFMGGGGMNTGGKYLLSFAWYIRVEEEVDGFGLFLSGAPYGKRVS